VEEDVFGHEAAKGRVVVVDEDQGARQATSGLLTADGYEVVQASGIDEALSALEDGGQGVVVFRILKPPAIAIDFARRLALNRAIQFTPVVMVTSLDEYQIGSFLDGVPGVRRVVPSPCGADALRAEVAHAMRYIRR
jgi:DNA-binding response OmpR family regulator